MARAPKVTYAWLEGLIRQGRGQGHGNEYQPFLEIARWNPSRCSTQVVGQVPPYDRSCHFFCRSEWLLALMFAWIGAQVREQLPAWPWTHPHPLYGIHNDLDSVLPWSVGMRALCTDAGIDHGIFIGTVIPYIWTLDLVLTFTFADALPSCVVVSVKPLESERYQRIDPLDRGPEKLELEKRYAKGIGIPYFLADRSLYPGDLLGQLEWLASTARLPTQDQKYALLQRFLDGCSGEFTSTPPSELIRKIKTDFAVSKAAADFIVQHCLWHQYIDCDLSRYLDMEAPPLPGGVALRSALRRTLEGVAP